MAEAALKDRVEDALNEIRPMLERDGGGLDFVGVNEDDGVVAVRLTGACKGCPMAVMTLERGIEARLKDQIPEVTKVVNVPDEGECCSR
jgi:Fe-S cluster biogenesis protein NfuA